MSGPGNLQTSGNTSYNPVATEIITGAFRRLTVINEDEAPTSGMLKVGMDALNDMVTEWQATGIHVWTEEEGICFLQQGQYRYTIGDNTNGHFADAYNYSLGTAANGAAQGATSLVLATPNILAVPFALGQQVGIVLNSNTAFWTTINAEPSGPTISFADPLPAAVSPQAFVYAYTQAITRPLRIPFARRLAFQGMILTPLTNMMSRQEYQNLPQPLNPGLVTQAYYWPGRNTGELFVWNNPQDANTALRFTYYRPIQDFLTTDDAPDLPREWGNALKWNLASELTTEYSVPVQRVLMIEQKAQQKLELVMGWDREPESIYFGRGYDQTRR